MAKRLSKKFYLSDDVVQMSRDLLGKKLVTCFNGQRTSGIIVETEAYLGPIDKASHAYGWRRTKRTEVMYNEGGVAYVYLCYGMYNLFNVVVSKKNVPHAILVRAVEPAEGIELMLQRCKKQRTGHHPDAGIKKLTNGPGKLTRALGITTRHTGLSLIRNSPIWIEDGIKLAGLNKIEVSVRVGVAYAKEDALLPYRFTIKDNPYVSKGEQNY